MTQNGRTSWTNEWVGKVEKTMDDLGVFLFPSEASFVQS
jgi:hypothetical protein